MDASKGSAMVFCGAISVIAAYRIVLAAFISSGVYGAGVAVIAALRFVPWQYRFSLLAGRSCGRGCAAGYQAGKTGQIRLAAVLRQTCAIPRREAAHISLVAILALGKSPCR